MSHDKQLPESLYWDCITWNVPAIRKSGDDDANAFVDAVQLRMKAPHNPESEAGTGSTLQLATSGLLLEYAGQPLAARAHYEKVGDQPGSGGLLGLLLIAWMADATRQDFDRVEDRLKLLGSAGDSIARSHTKLAGWALDRGWPDLARHHFHRARESGEDELRAKLDELGHWFGESSRVRVRTDSVSDLIRFPWIFDFVNSAMRRSVEERVKESFKSPWARTWKVGDPSPEGIDMQSGAMQASWAGALWLVPTIQRLQAGLILNNSLDAADVSRAIAQWVRGGGSNVRQMVQALEGHLTHESVAELVIDRLHSGRSVVVDRRSWLELCLGLWSELPDNLVEKIVTEYAGPPQDLRPHSIDALKSELFARLALRSSTGLTRLGALSDEQLGMILRLMPPELAHLVPRDLRERGLLAALELQSGGVSDLGWNTLVKAWASLPEPNRSELRSALLGRIPAWRVARSALDVPDLVPPDALRERLPLEVDSITREIENAHRGLYYGSQEQAAFNIAVIGVRLGGLPSNAVRSLIELANDQVVQPSQRQAALEALRILLHEGVLSQTDVAPAYDRVEASHPVSSVNQASVDQRFENIQRLGLRLSIGSVTSQEEQLLAGSRDTDASVRHVALSVILTLLSRGEVSSIFDVALLGALYDPDPHVQALAVPAAWNGHFADPIVWSAARKRLLELWPSAPLAMRLAIAREAAGSEPAAFDLKYLAEQVEIDRSALVRAASKGGDTPLTEV